MKNEVLAMINLYNNTAAQTGDIDDFLISVEDEIEDPSKNAFTEDVFCLQDSQIDTMMANAEITPNDALQYARILQKMSNVF